MGRKETATQSHNTIVTTCLHCPRTVLFSTTEHLPVTCPYLDYRDEASERSFDEPRAYCTAANTFVQPMRADICNDRYDLDHETDCEIYREAEAENGV